MSQITDMLKKVTTNWKAGEKLEIIADSEGRQAGDVATVLGTVASKPGILNVQWDDGTTSELNVGLALFDRVVK